MNAYFTTIGKICAESASDCENCYNDFNDDSEETTEPVVGVNPNINMGAVAADQVTRADDKMLNVSSNR